MTKIYRIYYLQDPRTGNIFYVGLTSDSLRSRLNNHIFPKNSKTTPKDELIRQIKKHGFLPQIFELEFFTEAEIPCSSHRGLKEQYWMWQLRSWGFNILNIQGLELSKRSFAYTNYTSINKRTSLKIYGETVQSL